MSDYDPTKSERRDKRKDAARAKLKKSGMSVFTIMDVIRKRASGEMPVNRKKRKSR